MDPSSSGATIPPDNENPNCPICRNPKDPSDQYKGGRWKRLCKTCRGKGLNPSATNMKALKETGGSKLAKPKGTKIGKTARTAKKTPMVDAQESAFTMTSNIPGDENVTSVRQSTQTPEEIEEEKPWVDWLQSLSQPTKSVLLHPSSVISKVIEQGEVPAIILQDMYQAKEGIEWEELLERLRDVSSPTRLFQDFPHLQDEWLGWRKSLGTRAIGPIGLVAVALNNRALALGEPYQFVWIHVGHMRGLCMAFCAWSSAQRLSWEAGTPASRTKSCSAWETNVVNGAQAILVPYTEVNMPLEITRGQGRVLPWKSLVNPDINPMLAKCQACFVWYPSTISGLKEVPKKGQGELILIQKNHSGASGADKQGMVVRPGQCETTSMLFDQLVEAYKNNTHKLSWKDLQPQATREIMDALKPTAKRRIKAAGKQEGAPSNAGEAVKDGDNDVIMEDFSEALGMEKDGDDMVVEDGGDATYENTM